MSATTDTPNNPDPDDQVARYPAKYLAKLHPSPPADGLLDRDKLIIPAELADFLGIPPKTLRRWRYLGAGPEGLRVCRHVRYRPEAVRAWLAAQDSREAS
jgi:Helix-turn-helix domain